jgi:transposase
MLGKKTMEAEILKEAVDFNSRKKWIARAPLLPRDGEAGLPGLGRGALIFWS